MTRQHTYALSLQWTGNKGAGTSNYRSYDRSYVLSVVNKSDIPGSSDPSFMGDKTKYNPEELFVASLAACHMLWYLHLCSEAGVIVVDYQDSATGIMEEDPSGTGRFTEVNLHPVVTLSDPAVKDIAEKLHEKANKLCFIANSCNFPVRHHPTSRIVYR